MAMVLAAGWSEAGLGSGDLEVLGAASRLAALLDASFVYASLGPDAQASAHAAATCGPDRCIAIAGLDAINDLYVTALAGLVSEMQPQYVLLPTDARGREIAPRLAGRVGGCAINDVVEMVSAAGEPAWTRPVFGGKALATLAPTRLPLVLSLGLRRFEPAISTGVAVAVEERISEVGPSPIRIVRRLPAEGGERLEDASVIVSGGRGVGDEATFSRLQDLAHWLGGSVGASLAAVDQGWATPAHQVGLSGKVVSPQVYFAVGISGASQHLAGLASVKALVAINSDAKAPIFDAARLGVVMDCHVLLPALIEEAKRRDLRG